MKKDCANCDSRPDEDKGDYQRCRTCHQSSNWQQAPCGTGDGVTHYTGCACHEERRDAMVKRLEAALRQHYWRGGAGMKTEKRCGTCRFWKPLNSNPEAYGECLWQCACGMPFWAKHQCYGSLGPLWGEDCPAWKRRRVKK